MDKMRAEIRNQTQRSAVKGYNITISPLHLVLKIYSIVKLSKALILDAISTSLWFGYTTFDNRPIRSQFSVFFFKFTGCEFFVLFLLAKYSPIIILFNYFNYHIMRK